MTSTQQPFTFMIRRLSSLGYSMYSSSCWKQHSGLFYNANLTALCSFQRLLSPRFKLQNTYWVEVRTLWKLALAEVIAMSLEPSWDDECFVTRCIIVLKVQRVTMNECTSSATMLRHTVALQWSSICNEGPNVCQGNTPCTITSACHSFDRTGWSRVSMPDLNLLRLRRSPTQRSDRLRDVGCRTELLFAYLWPDC